MPNSVLVLEVGNENIKAKLHWPLKEFQLVFPEEDLNDHANTLIARKGKWLDEYLLSHVMLLDSFEGKWQIAILNKYVDTSQQVATGKYNELTFELLLTPPDGATTRSFTMYYDAIMHQLVTHKMFINVRQDWDNGYVGDDSSFMDLGILMVNTADGSIPPVIVNLNDGSKWSGFKKMVDLGMHHISGGIDHLMFLLVLMLPAPLIASSGRWTKAGGTRYSMIRLLKIATAFTIGHSLTLLAGAFGWFRLPSQPVEVLIALSILIGAIHALKPIFPGKEVLIASGFGLVHGLAFATVLSSLELDSVRMSLSILGFNIGIEMMQLFVILLFMPWLVILSFYSIYKYLRVLGALAAIVASVAWIIERITGRANFVADTFQSLESNGHWVILGVALLAIFMLLRQRGLSASKSV